MKKRISAIVLAVALCLSLLVSALSVSATETPHFLAVNENLLQLEDRYIPIVADGMYYVPYYALDVSSTGVDLGIYPVYNTAIRTLTIYNREKVVVFDLTKGTCTERNGTVHTARAVTRNGQVYIPAKFVCNLFGLKYSDFSDTGYGPMVRICSASAKLSDRHFLAAAQMQMEGRLRDWRKNQGSVTPVPTPTPTATTPVPTPSVPEVDKSDVRTYLGFQAEQVETMSGLLDWLEPHQIKGLFFFPADRLEQYDEQIRRVLIGGHGIGLILSGETAQELASSAMEGNSLLRQIAYTGTYTVLLPDGLNSETVQELEAGGLLVWQTDVDARFNGQSVSTRAGEVRDAVEIYDDAVYILSDCSAFSLNLMLRLVPDMVADRYNFRLAVETEL